MHFPVSKVARFSPPFSAGSETDSSHSSTISEVSGSSCPRCGAKTQGAQSSIHVCPRPGNDPEMQARRKRNSGGMMRKLKRVPSAPHLKIDSNAANSYYRQATCPETPTTASTALSLTLLPTPLTADYRPPLSPARTGKNLDYAFPPFPTANGGVMANVYRLAGFDYNPSTQQLYLHHPQEQSVPPRKASYSRAGESGRSNEVVANILHSHLLPIVPESTIEAPSSPARPISPQKPQVERTLAQQLDYLVPKRPAPQAPSPRLRPTAQRTAAKPLDVEDSLNAKAWSASISSTNRTSLSSSRQSASNESSNSMTSVEKDTSALEEPVELPTKLRILSHLQAKFAVAQNPAPRFEPLMELADKGMEESPMSPGPVGSFTKVPDSKATEKSKCHGCGLPIMGKSIRSVDGRVPGKWHRECFICTACKSPFPTGEFYVLDSTPYCARDYHLQNGSICAVCGDGVEGECLELENATTGDDDGTIGEDHETASERRCSKRVHATCFRCWECRVLLKDEYYEMQGQYLCEVHATQTYNKVRAQLFAVGGMMPSTSLESAVSGIPTMETRRTRVITMTMI
ncbi:hypothetical protein V1517DRAFT_108466 [Lipomyces orientalis]|uniref:Uncharacterized protein n=1 Tax=Lipomyces orientalis TaxID=1233043 RepID=A0ACC3TPU6_9ASCO